MRVRCSGTRTHRGELSFPNSPFPPHQGLLRNVPVRPGSSSGTRLCSLLSLATKGSLYLNENLINITGMEPSFWIAIALAYLEFLQDKDVSLSVYLRQRARH